MFSGWVKMVTMCWASSGATWLACPFMVCCVIWQHVSVGLSVMWCLMRDINIVKLSLWVLDRCRHISWSMNSWRRWSDESRTKASLVSVMSRWLPALHQCISQNNMSFFYYYHRVLSKDIFSAGLVGSDVRRSHPDVLITRAGIKNYADVQQLATSRGLWLQKLSVFTTRLRSVFISQK